MHVEKKVVLAVAEEEQSPAPEQHAALKQQGVDPELVSQQMLMQQSGHEKQPERVAAVGRADADEPVEVVLCFPALLIGPVANMHEHQASSNAFNCFHMMLLRSCASGVRAMIVFASET